MRPAIELLARVGIENVDSIVDLGCGTGVALPLLGSRWPLARYVGVDNSPEMLASASSGFPKAEFIEADISEWHPDAPVDLIYSNATLHWLPDHESLLPRLMSMLNPRGALAVQMPANFDQPTHTAITDVARECQWSVDLEPLLLGQPVRRAEEYFKLLSPISRDVDVWTTTYLQRLTGPDAVTQWTSGSALRLVLEVLTESERTTFVNEYTSRVNEAYPVGADGVTLLPFTRLFIAATAFDL